MNKKIIAATVLVIALVFAGCFTVVPVFAKPDNPGPPDVQQKIFIHFAKPDKPAKSSPSETGYYKLIGAKWKSFPVPLEVNPSQSGLNETFVLRAIYLAAEEWDDGAYSGWGGVTPNLFNDTITTNYNITYDDLAWTNDKRDGKNTLLWGNYSTPGVIAVTILWYNVKTKEILEFDIVFDTDYKWGNATETAGVMDLQNIATHELGHGAGLDDVYQSSAYQETMYGYSSAGETIKRDLYIGDKKGITKLYG